MEIGVTEQRNKGLQHRIVRNATLFSPEDWLVLESQVYGILEAPNPVAEAQPAAQPEPRVPPGRRRRPR